MDGVTGVFVGFVGKVVGLGIDHTFSEIAASGKHKRELEVLDHQLERTAAIASAQGGSNPSPTVPTVPKQTVKVTVTPSLAPTCRLPEEDGALDMPTTEETITALKERLVKELYRVELDLQGGGRIAGRACDCLSKKKHTAGINATAEELMSYDTNPLYGQIVTWFEGHAKEFEPAEIAKHEPGYYQAMTPEIRNFRKQLEV